MRMLSLVAGLTMAGVAPAAAVQVDWELADEYGTSLGGFRLDFSDGSVSLLEINGWMGTYTIETTFVFLDTTDHLNGHEIQDFLLFFSPVTGTVYRDDYGGGEFFELRVNESAMRLGTLNGPLSIAGGTYDVVIAESYNYDETYAYCAYYEEIYDPETGEYLGEGPCLYVYTDSYYNIEAGDTFYGTLTGTPVGASAEVPAPGALGLLATGVGLLAVRAARRRVLGGASPQA